MGTETGTETRTERKSKSEVKVHKLRMRQWVVLMHLEPYTASKRPGRIQGGGGMGGPCPPSPLGD